MEVAQIKGGHTVTAFDDEIAEIAIAINAMSHAATHALDAAMDALVSSDRTRAKELIAQDLRLDALETELERKVTRCIALRAPVADDLRYLMMAIRIAAMLERSGDHAKNMAKRTGTIDLRASAPLMHKLREMSRLGSSMLAQSVDCFNRGEAALAVVVRDRDDHLNAQFDAFTDLVTRAMREDEAFVPDGVQMLFISKQLERVGDYAKKIADSVNYIVTGEYLAA